MTKKIFIISGMSILLFTGGAFAQSSSEVDKAQPATTLSPEQIIIDSRIPSAYQFLIGLCEVKEGVYYMPKTKFAELTEPQQNYVRNNNSLFVIKN
jgi:hypothetical protein